MGGGLSRPPRPGGGGHRGGPESNDDENGEQNHLSEVVMGEDSVNGKKDKRHKARGHNRASDLGESMGRAATPGTRDDALTKPAAKGQKKKGGKGDPRDEV